MPFPAAPVHISICRQRRRRFGRRAGRHRGSSDPLGRTLAACSTSPRLRGEVGAKRRVRGSSQELRTWGVPLTPPSPRKRGEGAYRARGSDGGKLKELQRLPLRNELGVEVGAEPLDAAFATVAGFLHPAERRLGRRRGN